MTKNEFINLIAQEWSWVIPAGLELMPLPTILRMCSEDAFVNGKTGPAVDAVREQLLSLQLNGTLMLTKEGEK